MIKILIKFWPVFVPIILYMLWYHFSDKKNRQQEDEIPEWEARLWNWTLLVSLIIAIGCLLWVGISSDSNVDSTYVPPKYEDGKVIPGKMISNE